MSLQLVLPGQFSDDALPRFEKDPILTKGSVYLIDPSHPMRPWESGVPIGGGSVPNLVSSHNLPDGLSEAPAMKFYADPLLAGEHGLVERSAKGGLHVVVSQSSQAVKDTPGAYYAGVADRAPTAPPSVTPLQQWLFDGAYSHGFYMSLWARVTRPSKDGPRSVWVSQLVNHMSSSAHYNVALVTMQPPAENDHRPPPSSPNFAGTDRDMAGVGAKFNAVASHGKSNDSPTSANNAYVVPFVLGAAGTVNQYLDTKGSSPSMILYRAYLEDLTVSGRTFAEVREIDRRLYDREVLTPGGRYHGDGFTDPSTIP